MANEENKYAARINRPRKKENQQTVEAQPDQAQEREKTFKMAEIQEIINSLKAKFEEEINSLKDYTDNNNRNIKEMQNKINLLEVSTIQANSGGNSEVRESSRNMVSDSMTCSRETTGPQAKRVISSLKKPQAHLAYANEASEPKTVSFQIEEPGPNAKAKQAKQKVQKPAMKLAPDSDLFPSKQSSRHSRTDSQERNISRESSQRVRHQSNVKLNLVDSQIQENDESPPCPREVIKPLEKP